MPFAVPDFLSPRARRRLFPLAIAGAATGFVLAGAGFLPTVVMPPLVFLPLMLLPRFRHMAGNVWRRMPVDEGLALKSLQEDFYGARRSLDDLAVFFAKGAPGRHALVAAFPLTFARLVFHHATFERLHVRQPHMPFNAGALALEIASVGERLTLDISQGKGGTRLFSLCAPQLHNAFTLLPSLEGVDMPALDARVAAALDQQLLLADAPTPAERFLIDNGYMAPGQNTAFPARVGTAHPDAALAHAHGVFLKGLRPHVPAGPFHDKITKIKGLIESSSTGLPDLHPVFDHLLPKLQGVLTAYQALLGPEDAAARAALDLVLLDVAAALDRHIAKAQDQVLLAVRTAAAHAVAVDGLLHGGLPLLHAKGAIPDGLVDGADFQIDDVQTPVPTR